MKKNIILFLLMTYLMNSCGSSTHTTQSRQPVRKPSVVPSNSGIKANSVSQTEQEYQTLMKTYKSETAQVLTSLLNDSSDSPTIPITVENKSNCNMVLTISGQNYFKKIPIGVNKIGSAMVPKNQNYNLSGMLCNTVYQKTKFITSSYNIKLSN